MQIPSNKIYTNVTIPLDYKIDRNERFKHLKFFNIIPEVLYDKFQKYSDDYLFIKNKDVYIHNILNKTHFVENENMSYNKE